MKTIIDKSECNPLSDNIEGKLVVIDSNYFKPEYKTAKYQLVLACSGFGCDVNKLGSAVFVMECVKDNPECYRQERNNLIGEPRDELIKGWKELYGEFNEEVLEALKK